MVRANSIILKCGDPDHVGEHVTGTSTVKPGHILQENSDGTVQPYSVIGGLAQTLMCIEDAMQGQTIDATYATSEIVQTRRFKSGDKVQVRVAAGALAITNNMRLQSDGAGGVQPHTQSTQGGLLYASVAASTSLTNSTTPTTFDTKFTLPANSLAVGDVINIRGYGTTPTTNSTDTLAVNVQIGALTVLAIPALDVADANFFTFDVKCTVRSISTTTCTFNCEGTYAIGAAAGTVKDAAPVTGTINSTIANVIGVQGTWSVASASDIAILQNLKVEISRPVFAIMSAAEAVDNSLGATDALVNAKWI